MDSLTLLWDRSVKFVLRRPGVAMLVLGSFSGLGLPFLGFPGLGIVSAQTVETRIPGQAGDRMGVAMVAFSGTKTDLIVGSPYAGSGGLRFAGSVARISAESGEARWTAPGLFEENLGYSLAILPDLNEDGIFDVAAGAPGRGHGAGGVSILSGADGSVLQVLVDPEENSSLFGSSVASIGDIDDDGVGDLAVGAPGLFDPGMVFLFSGVTGGLIKRLEGSHGADRYGAAVAGVGDLDGDGVSDFAVGAPDSSDRSGGQVEGARGFAGAVTVYSGTSQEVLLALRGSAPRRRLGDSIAGLPDVDGDGVDDLLIGGWGAPGANGLSSGAVFVVSGAEGTLIRRFEGDGQDDRFGQFVTKLADLDGDGVEDFGVGAICANPGGRVDAGIAYVFSSLTGDLIFRFEGTEAGEGAGAAIALLGDLNRGGTPEVAVASPYYSTETMRVAGVVTVLALDDPPPPPVACSLSLPTDLEACTGELVSAGIQMTEAVGVIDLAVTLSFDPLLALVVSVEPGAVVGSRSFDAVLDNRVGRLEIRIGGDAPFEEIGELVRLVLVPLGEPGISVDLALTGVANAGASEEECESMNGSLVGLECGSPEGVIAGTVRYYEPGVSGSDGLAVSGVVLELSGERPAEAVSLADGAYRFENVPAGDVTVRPRKSGETLDSISALDLSLVARYVVGLYPFDERQKLAADVSGDGQVTSLDASLMAQFVVGSLSRFPAAEQTGSDWLFLPGERDYSSVEGEILGEDYTAIVLGDVTGNWGQTGGGLRAGGDRPSAGEGTNVDAWLVRIQSEESEVGRYRLFLPEGIVADSVDVLLELDDRFNLERAFVHEDRGNQTLLAFWSTVNRVRLVAYGSRTFTGGAVADLVLSLREGVEIADVDAEGIADPIRLVQAVGSIVPSVGD